MKFGKNWILFMLKRSNNLHILEQLFLIFLNENKIKFFTS